MTDSRENSDENAVGGRHVPAETIYAFGPFQFSVTRLLLTMNGEPVRLGSRATSILHALVERPGELVSKEDLVARAWPSTHVEEGNLRVHIASLRRALGDGGDVPVYIANVAGRGYRFLAPVRRVVTPVDRTYDDASSEPSGNLPRNAGPLVGRDADLEALASILGQARHTTLIGPGGIGKTSVAVAVGNGAREGFQNAVYFVDLAAVSDPSFVPFAFASSVNVAIDTERPVDSLATRLRNDRALLVVDNCEHLIEPAALVVESLLNSAPGIHILATSHEPLRTKGERVYRLAPFMPPPGADALPLREAIESPAIELFVRHMLSSDESAFVGDADVPYIVDICRRLDGLPLAIEIAATRAGALGIAELASRLDDRLGILTSGRRTAAVRHQTLRNMLDWSHTLLSGRDRTILRRLSVFAGEFSLDAAGLVTRDESLNAAHVMEGLSNLVRKSLLVQTSTGGSSTYRLLDSVRLYAFEKLEGAGEVRRVRLLHVSYLCDVLRRAEADWRTMPTSLWTGDYQRYVDDIRTALKWSLEDDNDREGGVVLTSLVLPLAMQLGLHDEFRERMFMAMERARGLARPVLLPELRLHVAKNAFTFNVGQPLDVLLERAVEIGELLDDDRHRLEPLIQISSCHAVLGQYEAAAEVGARALELAGKCADEFAILSASRAMAQAAHYVGRHRTAIRLARAVLHHPVRNIPYTYGFVHTDRRISMRFILARSLWITGRAEEALLVAQEGLSFAEDAGPVALAQLLGTGVLPVLLWRGDWEAARSSVQHLLQHSERYSFKYWHQWGVVLESVIARKEGRGNIVEGVGDFQMQNLATLAGLAAPLPDSKSDADWSAPEIIRLRGERLLAAGDVFAGETAIENALALARQHGALSWELRAAMSLVRARQNGPRRMEAVDLLNDVVDRMPEGLDTEDPVAAKALLDQLRGF